MTDKTIYKLVIATFGDWMKNHSPYVQLVTAILGKLQVLARNSDWFIAQFVLVVIGQSNNYFFGIGFSTVI